jgi:hypothetical protein
VSVYKLSFFVIPAEAGIQNPLKSLDSRFHGNDIMTVYGQTLNRYPRVNTVELCGGLEFVYKLSLSACSPFGKGGWRGILRTYAYLLLIKSPLAPLFQRGG